MKNIAYFILAFIIAFGIFLYHPGKSSLPGPLLQGHEDLKDNCNKCHTPFQNDFQGKCLECHIPSKIGIFNVGGGRIQKKEAKQKFNHQNLKDLQGVYCTVCHTEHQVRSVKPFSHKKLTPRALDSCGSCHFAPNNKTHTGVNRYCAKCHNRNDWKEVTFRHSANQTNCQGCHKKPLDRTHAKIQGACFDCHNTQNWKNVQFKHTGEHSNCLQCHKKPADNLHKSSGTSCKSCHGFESWKGAKIDHDKYFRLGSRRHNVSCVKCHPGNNYSSYTCYGCHAHSERGVRNEHREEGIYEYSDCVLCHRSGSESEAKRRWKQIRSQGR